MIEEIKQKIADAEFILIGIGEEFEIKREDISKNHMYSNAIEKCKNNEQMISYIEKFFYENSSEECILERKNCYRQLAELVKGKNYFIVSLCMDGLIHTADFDEKRIVEPCGDFKRMQCSEKCTADLYDADVMFLKQIEEVIDGSIESETLMCPVCPKCGKPLVFNNISAENYLEEGYAENWRLYTKWLQGTVNRNLCIMELGVGMRFPTVIRWPFEKIAYFNHKASFIRVHSRLYQVAEEIKDKSIKLKAAPFDFLKELSN